MARDKIKNPEPLGVADDLDFSTDNLDDEEEIFKTSISPLSKGSNTTAKTDDGKNPYYTYHPKLGEKGKALGAPRKDVHRIQISIGCTKEEKILYQKAAKADRRKLPDFVNVAIHEYIENHNLQDNLD
ncbi:MAG: hypothetical protein K6B15_10365 [Parasporobacterium sp.]|nr:hypothetical protein [Parasporobacterium sp.]